MKTSLKKGTALLLTLLLALSLAQPQRCDQQYPVVAGL